MKVASITLGLAFIFTTSNATAQSNPVCNDALQGRVAWDYSGNTVWAENNMERLCQGGRGAEPAQCFQRVMTGGIDWGGGTQWQWANAITLCRGSRDADATVACFQSQRAQGMDWRGASSNCTPNALQARAAGLVAARANEIAAPPIAPAPPQVPMRVWTILVQVSSTKPSGSAWDAFGGAPDVAICTQSSVGRDCGNGRRFQDSFGGTFTRSAPSSFTLFVVDLDVSADDPIGNCFIDHPGTYRCGSATVTAQ
jgi:hypothetical protein